MLLGAALLALILAWPRLSRQSSTLRLVAEVFGFAVNAVALVETGWALPWLNAQRW
jgi:hypothetical protein